MSQQLGSEVEWQGKANKSTIPRTPLSFQSMYSEGYSTLSVCLSTFILPRHPVNNTNCFRTKKAGKGVFPDTTTFKRYCVKTSKKSQ